MDYTYNFHDLVGIRLEGATAADASAISRQYGRTYAPLAGDADITIRMLAAGERPPVLRTLGLHEAAFTDDAFFVVRGRGAAQALAQIPFDAVGGQCTIQCINGPAALASLLTPLLNLTMLHEGVLPVHATAFNFEGKGVMATGWSRSGKTEILLAFMANGAEYVGDEYIYLQDGGAMFGIPRPLTLWEWHLPDLQRYWEFVAAGEQRRIKRLQRLIGLSDWAVQRLFSQRSYVGQSIGWFRGEMRRRLATKLWPQDVFGERASTQQGHLDTVLFTIAHTSPEIRLQRIDASEVAGRMAYSMEQQRQHFRDVYLKYKFAFPANTNDLIEKAFQLEQASLARFLSGTDSYVLYHPADADFQTLYASIRSIL